MYQQEKQIPCKHIKLGIIGNVDAGKSTLVAVLTKGMPDDGNGGARTRIFNYKHEQQTGRTSSIAQQIMGFNEEGKQIIPQRFNQNKNKYWKEVVKDSAKIISIVDLCGHEKYLKTTINGLTGLAPDFGCVVVGANMGLSKMTRQHIGLCLFLKIPFFVIVTKIDLAPENKYEQTISEIKKILKSKLLNRFPILMSQQKTTKIELQKTAQQMPTATICPIFPVSSVSKKGFNILIDFISKLNVKIPTIEQLKSQPFEFKVNQCFVVDGVGIILSGIVKSGIARLNDLCLLGPDKLKNFKSVQIKSIHVSRNPCEYAVAGDLACLNVKSTKANQKLVRKDIRRGMVLINQQNKPEPVTQFEAELQVLHHSTTIKPKYEGVLHCGTIQQTVTLVKIFKDKEEEEQLLRNEDRGLVLFKFKYQPEFIKVGETILLREGKTKIIGVITRIVS